MGITSESQLIDISTIRAECQKIRTTAKDFKTCSDVIKDASGICDENALSVEGQTLQDTIDEVADGVANVQNDLNSFADSIESSANEVYNLQNKQLQEYRESLKKKK